MFNNQNGFYDGSLFNRYANLDNIEWTIIQYLVNSKSKYADNLWKILKYNTADCLLKPSVSRADRLKLIYTSNGDASVKRVFMTPFIDDAFTEQCSHIHIYVGPIQPDNNITSKVNIVIETIVHNKISNIMGEATGDDMDNVNPVELSDDETPITLFKNRETVMLKSIIADLNGRMVNGVGVLQFNRDLSQYDVSKPYLWNNRSFYGHSTTMTTIISGVSEDSVCGY